MRDQPERPADAAPARVTGGAPVEVLPAGRGAATGRGDVAGIAARRVAVADIAPRRPSRLGIAATAAGNQLAIFGAHIAAIGPSVFVAHVLAKAEATQFDADTPELKEFLTRLSNAIGLAGMTGSLLYERVFPPATGSANKMSDAGRLVLAASVVATWLFAEFRKATSDAAASSLRLLPFPLIREFLLVAIAKGANVNPANRATLGQFLRRNAVLSIAYMGMQWFFNWLTRSTNAFGGASHEALEASWAETMHAAGVNAASYASAEAMTAVLTRVATLIEAQFGAESGLTPDEIAERLRSGEADPLWRKLAQDSVDPHIVLPRLGFTAGRVEPDPADGKLLAAVKKVLGWVELIDNGEFGVRYADQMMKRGILNWAFFQAIINLNGVLPEIAALIADDPATQAILGDIGPALGYMVLFPFFDAGGLETEDAPEGAAYGPKPGAAGGRPAGDVERGAG